jgi:S-DNA-T family DNA segregation ATPase FtsK/SpoIIIE
VPRQGARRGGVAFGLLDLPSEQRRDVAEWMPREHGNVLVLGAVGSGKSWALEAIGGQLVPPDPACAWDAVDDLVRALDRQNDLVVLLDDLDALLPRFGGDHAAAFEERLARVLREGPARGIRLVAAAQRLTAHVQQLAPLLPARLLLRQPNRQELVLAGGDGDAFTPALPPGGGLWFGDRVQVSRVEPPVRTSPSPRQATLRAAPLAIVTPRVAALSAAAMAAGLTVVDLALADPSFLSPTTAVIGDIDEWQSRWGAIAALRPVAEVLLEGCSAADFRALTRQRELPPPLSPGLCWRLDPDGGASRARLPWT